MKLTKQQFDNINFITQEIRKKYPEFQGFNGSANDMQVIGFDEKTVEDELKNIVIPDSEPPKTEKEYILEVLGLTEEDISTLKVVTAEKAIK